MSIEERLFFLLASVLTGVLSALIALFIKERFDRKREVREKQTRAEEIRAYLDLDRTYDTEDEQEPIVPLMRFRKNALAELKKDSEWNEKTLSIWRLYLDSDKQLLEWVKHQEESDRVKAKDMVTVKKPNA